MLWLRWITSAQIGHCNVPPPCAACWSGWEASDEWRAGAHGTQVSDSLLIVAVLFFGLHLVYAKTQKMIDAYDRLTEVSDD